MITAELSKNELIITGKMKEGDKVHGLCCSGYDWECLFVIISACGFCHNPDCNAGVYDDGDATYRGVSSWCYEDIADFLLGESA